MFPGLVQSGATTQAGVEAKFRRIEMVFRRFGMEQRNCEAGERRGRVLGERYRGSVRAAKVK
jgi:hypothetical protein